MAILRPPVSIETCFLLFKSFIQSNFQVGAHKFIARPRSRLLNSTWAVGLCVKVNTVNRKNMIHSEGLD